MGKKFFLVLGLLGWCLIFLTSPSLFLLVQAGGGGGGDSVSVTIPNPVGCPDFRCVAQQIIGSLVTLAIPVVAVMVLIGGFYILTAGGDPEKFKTGKKTILYAVIGYAVILLAEGVVLIVDSLLKR